MFCYVDELERPMCNLYSMTKNQAAIIALTRAMRDTTGNLPTLPVYFPITWHRSSGTHPMVCGN